MCVLSSTVFTNFDMELDRKFICMARVTCAGHQCYRIDSDYSRQHQPGQDRLASPSSSIRGFLQSPNWPGDYPHNVRCTWTLGDVSGGVVDVEVARGSNRRRLLVVVTEVALSGGTRRSNVECGDSLVITEHREGK